MNAPAVRVSLYAAVLAAGGAFGLLFTGESYGEFAVSNVPADRMGAFFTMLGATLVALLVASSGRYRFVLILPAAAAYTLLAVYGWPPFTWRGWRELFWEIGTDVYGAAGTMYMQRVPYDLAPGLFVVLIPVVMIVAAFATSATLYEESPVVSVAVLGVTIGVLSTIGFEVGAGPYFAVFLVAAVVLLLAAGSSGTFPRPGVLVGAVVVALVLAVPKAPFSETTANGGIIDWTRIGTGGTNRLNVQADVGDYLTAGRDAELLRIRSEEPLMWRAGTLDYFDGFQWQDTTDQEQGYGEEVGPTVETDLVRQEVEVLDARTDRVFGGYRIIGTSLDYAERNTDGSWSVDEPLAKGRYYWILSKIPQPNAAQLRDAGSDYPADVQEKFLQLPNSTPGVVAERAREIEERYDPATPYDRARAIERFLRYDGGFVYDLDVGYRRADTAVEEFLGDGKRGFCTQFATSMALIAREMDLPSRVVYGSTPGEEVEPDEYVVTGRNMHTWVEIYFPGVGWYPFDPTPGFSMPTTMQENAPAPLVSATGRNLGPEQMALQQWEQAEQPVEESPERRDIPDPERDPAGGSSGRTPAWPFVVLAAALLVASVPLTKRALLVRGRPEDLYRDLVGRLRDVLPPGRAALADSPALTPTERVMLLAGAAGVEEKPFEAFARAYSDHLYSAGTVEGRDLPSSHRRATRAFEKLPLWRRMTGAVNPSSLLARARRSVGAASARAGKSLRRLSGKLRR